MEQTLLAIVLGLGTGALIAGVAISLVVTYRGTGVINLAAGAVSMFTGYAFWALREGSFGHHFGAVSGFILVVLIAAAVGVAMEVLAFRPLRTAAPLAKLVSSLGIFLLLQAIVLLSWGSQPQIEPSFLPTTAITLFDVFVPIDRFILTGIVILIALVLAAFYRWTRFGLATRAAAENEVSAMLAGHSPNRLSMVNTVIACVVAGLLGVLAAPLITLDPQSLPLIVVPALAAALLGRFDSLAVACIAGLAIGAGENLVYYASTKSWFPTDDGVPMPGVSELLVFFVVVIALFWRGANIPGRGAIIEKRLPAAPRPERLLEPAVLAVVLVGVALVIFPFDFRQALINSMIGAVLVLSLTVVTGFVGQVSLMQLALSGVAGFIISHLATDAGIGFPLAPLIGALGATLVGLLTAVSALRVRGVTLAVVTLAAAVAIERFGFISSTFGGGNSGAPVPQPHLFGINLGNDAAFRGLDGKVPSPVLGFGILVVTILLCIFVSNLRRGTFGPRMLAVRSNERAAAAAGINVRNVKLTAFGFGAFIAGIAGALYGYNFGSVSAERFSALTAFTLIAFAFVGGITMVSGALFAGFMATEGLSQHALDRWFGVSGTWTILFAAIALIGNLAIYPDGIAGANYHKKMRKRRQRELGLAKPSRLEALVPQALKRDDDRAAIIALEHEVATAPHRERERVEPRELVVEDLTVRYGGVTAVDGVSLTIKPGEIVGLIGPNGAGKSSLIDALSGFVRPLSGRVLFDGVEVTRVAPHDRVRAGLVRSWQSLDLFEDSSVLENVQAAADRPHWRVLIREILWPRRSSLSAAAAAAVHDFGLTDDLHRLPGDLSFSQRRLVTTARAVSLNPSVLLLDEPAGGMSDGRRAGLAAAIRPLAREQGMGLLVVDHDMPFVMGLCDRIIVLNFGRKIADGTPAEVRADPEVLAAYLRGDAEEHKPAAGASAASAATQVPVAPRHDEVLLEARGLAVGYYEHPVVRGLEFDIRRGEVVALLGANRAGKTTTLLGLAGAIQPIEGEVYWLGEPVQKRVPLNKRAAQGLGFLPDERAVFRQLTVAENLRVDRNCDVERVLALFPELEGLMHKQAGLLSGGEQQMLGLGRAISRRPKVLLVDEVSLGLAPRVVRRLMDVLRQAADEDGVGVIVVEQHVPEALRISDRVCVIAGGRMLLTGSVGEVGHRVEEAFLSDVLGTSPDHETSVTTSR